MNRCISMHISRWFKRTCIYLTGIYHAQVVHKTGPVLPDLRWGAAEWLHSDFLTAVQFPHRPHHHMHRIKHQRWRELWRKQEGCEVGAMETKRERTREDVTRRDVWAEMMEWLTGKEGGREYKREERGREEMWGMSKPVGRKHGWIHQYPLNTSKRLSESL